jgi:translation initiation factor IF-2
VKRLTKVRVYELAKELNTNSKRLMEKLAEIDIVVKNHMSQLEQNQVEALYKHIGIRVHEAQTEEVEKKPVQPVLPTKSIKTGPRIIRKTQINLDEQEERMKASRDHQAVKKGGSIPIFRDGSGLMPGLTRNKAVVPNVKRRSETSSQEASMQSASRFMDPSMEEKQPLPQTALFHNDNADISHAAKVPEDLASISKENPIVANENSNILLSQEPKVQEAGEQGQQGTEVLARQERDLDERNAQRPTTQRPTTQRETTQRETTQRPTTQRENREFRPNPPSGDQRGYSGNRDSRPYTANRDARGGTPNRDPRSSSSSADGQRPRSPMGNRDGNGSSNRPYGSGMNGPRSGPNDRGARPGASSPSSYQRGEQRPGAQRPGAPRPGAPRPGTQRPTGAGGQFADRKKPGLPLKEDLIPTASKPESKRDYQNKVSGREAQKEVRKDIRKESAKPVAQKGDKRIQKHAIVGEKKGVSEVLSEEFVLKEFYDDKERRKKIQKNKGKGRNLFVAPPKQAVSLIKISGDVTVKDLAEALKKTSTEVIKKLMALGVMATLNQEIDLDTATLLADEFGVKVEKGIVLSEEDILFDDEEEENEEALTTRPPVVVVMGHVDHGKTSLLDTLRKTNVMDKEAGGITQHIGAYTVNIRGRSITFLDTPGHEAFTAMRARGAQVTDIAILVVAADDGVMPQTIEAIHHAKAAKVNIIVAINKMDKPGANPERVKQELTEHGLVVEEWGGDVIAVPVSAKEGTNIEQLLEMVLLSADMLELKVDAARQAKGTVIEAKLDKDRGPVATVLVQRGTLKQGDSVVSGMSVGRIRAMVDDKGDGIKSAGPSTPVEILGLPDVLEAGELFYAISDEKVAKQLAEKRRFKLREQNIKATSRITLDDLYSQIKEGKVKDLNIIVKADVQGSVEAVKQSLQKLSNESVRVNIIHGGVGTITETDVSFADVSNAIIIGFNVRPSNNVVDMAKDAGVDLRLYRVIYKAIEDIEAAMKGMLDPTYQEVVLGHVQVRKVFKASGIGLIGGGYVIDGKVTRNHEIRVVRDGVVVFEGKFGSLKRFKDDAKEVQQGYECGFTVDKFNDIKMDDVIECFHMEEVKR